jgi:proton-dependent oligopeptide transporter, POT family
MEQTAVATAAPRTFSDHVADYFRGFAVLRDTAREYWAIQVVNFLYMTAYFALTDIAVVFLSEQFGFSDERASHMFTPFSVIVTLCLLVSGLVSDWLGIRRALYVAMGGSLVLHAVIAMAGLQPDLPNRETIVLYALWALAPFIAMGQTVFQAANRRYTTGRSRGAGFNLWYLFMNVGAACAGFLVDIVRKGLHANNSWIIAFGSLTSILCLLVTFVWIRNEQQRLGPDESPQEAAPVRRRNPLSGIMAVLSEPVFWRFLVLVFLLLGVRCVFLYLHLMCPKYWLRVIGPDAPIGTLLAINPILVIIGLILVIPFLGRFSVYGMLVYGSLISAASLFILAIPAHGSTIYLTTICALIVLTVGEIIWSPRLTEYTAAIAPKGQEGTYLGLSVIPYFLAKLIVTFASGHMLARWVPEYPKGEPILRDRLAAGEIPFWSSPSAMWLLLGVIGVAGALVALALRRWFTSGAHWKEHAAH